MADPIRSSALTTKSLIAPFPSRILVPCGGFVIFGGAERMTFEALRIFRENGAAVHCILNSWENDPIARAAENIGATWSTGSYVQRFRRNTRSPVQFIRMAWDIILNSHGLIRDWLKFRAPVVIAADFGAILRNGPALLLLKLLGVKIVLWLHNAPPGERFYRRLFRAAIDPLVTRYVCVSKHTQSELLAFGIPPKKVAQVNNFAPIRARSARAIARDPNRVLFVGQMIPQKGLDLLLDAISQVAARGYNVRLDVVGKIDGWIFPGYLAYRDSVLRRATQSDLDGRVNFLGWRDDVPDLLQSVALHCAPSSVKMLEGMPLVCLEAKEAGTPSVVSPVGPFPELVTHKVDGWICEDLTPDAFADGIEFFLSDPVRAEAAGRSALLSSARFSRTCFQAGWEAVFEALDA